MGLTADLTSEVNKIIKETWETREGTKVPEAEEIQLGNKGVTLEATCLYADLAESTSLVNTKKATFAAEVYKCYLNCACRIIRDRGGVVTAFDGDRVMGVFIGTSKNTSAVRAALAINHAVVKIINPSIKAYYGDKVDASFEVRHSTGVDTSKVLVARTGIRGANDLVWVGRAANYAAKLCSLRDAGYATWITSAVHDNMDRSVKIASNGSNMWEARTWSAESQTVYRSSWHWGLE